MSMKEQKYQRPQQPCAIIATDTGTETAFTTRYQKRNDDHRTIPLHQSRTILNGYQPHRPITEIMTPVNKTSFTFTSPNKNNRSNGHTNNSKMLPPFVSPNIQAPPPPPPPQGQGQGQGQFVTPISSKKKSSTENKMSSRAHLVNVRVLHKNAILVTGLPKRKFDTAKAIEQEFKKYGVITNCLVNPKGILSVEKQGKRQDQESKKGGGSMDGKELTSSRLSKRSDDMKCTNGADGTNGVNGANGANGTIYIRFLHEKAAANAILATNGKYWGNNGDNGGNDGNGNRIKLHSCFVNNRYCDEFLQGRYCQDLNCILLHELIKPEKRRPNTGSTSNTNRSNGGNSNGNGNGSVTSSDSSNASMKSPKRHNCWKTPRRFLVAKESSRVNLNGKQNEDDSHFVFESCRNDNISQSSLYPNNRGYTRNDYDPHKSISSVTNMNMNSKSRRNQYGQYSMVTPQYSDMRYSQDYSSMMSFTNTGSCSGASTRCQNTSRSRVPIDLPVRQLFKNTTSTSNFTTENNVIAPPSARRRETIVNGIDNPWGIQSPVMIQKDNFHTSIQRKEERSDSKHHSFEETQNEAFAIKNEGSTISENQSSWSEITHRQNTKQIHHLNPPVFHGFDSCQFPVPITNNNVPFMHQRYQYQNQCEPLPLPGIQRGYENSSDHAYNGYYFGNQFSYQSTYFPGNRQMY